jgi:hypothetical protein
MNVGDDFRQPTAAFITAVVSVHIGFRLISQNLVQQLPHSALGFQNRAAMIHDAGQIRIREHYATEWGSPQNLARCGFSAIAKEKTWLRVEVCVPPAVQNDSRDVPPRIEPGARNISANC